MIISRLHQLKIWPTFYEAVRSGEKTFELRNNDRGFQRGDEVRLIWFNPATDEQRWNSSYPSLHFTIGFVLPVDSERVVFSLLPPPNEEDENGQAKT